MGTKTIYCYKFAGDSIEQVRLAMEVTPFRPLTADLLTAQGALQIERPDGTTSYTYRRGEVLYATVRTDSKKIDERQLKRLLDEWKSEYEKAHSSGQESVVAPQELIDAERTRLSREIIKYTQTKSSFADLVFDFKTGRLFIHCASQASADDLISLVYRGREKVDDFKISALTSPRILATRLTAILRKPDILQEVSDSLTLGSNLVVEFENKGKVAVKNLSLYSSEIESILRTGNKPEVSEMQFVHTQLINGESCETLFTVCKSGGLKSVEWSEHINGLVHSNQDVDFLHLKGLLMDAETSVCNMLIDCVEQQIFAVDIDWAVSKLDTVEVVTT